MTKKYTSSSIGYTIIKKDSSDSDSNYDTSSDESNYNSNSYSDSNDNSDDSDDNSVDKKIKSKGKSYISIKNSKYKKPITGTKQDFLTKEEIRNKLKGYKALRTFEDKKYLLKLKPFHVWIRYFNTNTNEFRIGGLLQKVDPELKFIMLINTTNKISWSVQLKDNIIFIPKNYEEKQQQKQRLKKEKLKEKQNEMIIKDKLYKLYLDGKLIKK